MYAVMDLFKLITFIFLLSHWVGCIYYFFGTYNDTPDSWVHQINMSEYSLFEIYITCVYFAYSTVSGVGYGDINPSDNLRLPAIVCMLIGTGLSAYLIGALNAIFNRVNIISKEMKLKSLHINQFLTHHKIPISLKAEILSYLDCLVEYK